MNHLGHRVSGYVDGELPGPTRDLVAGHLAVCPECRSAVAEASRIKGELWSLGGPAPPAGLIGSLLELGGPDDRSKPWAPRPSGSPAAAFGRRRPMPGAQLVAAGLAGVTAMTAASAMLAGGSEARDPAAHPERVAAIGGGIAGAGLAGVSGLAAPTRQASELPGSTRGSTVAIRFVRAR